MNLPFYIARRYLFAKKSHNAINIISLVSVCGIAIATMALICVLSVFNGFTDVAMKSFSAFDPDLQITAVQGKVFDPTSLQMQEVRALPDVALVSESLEENALLKFGDRQEPILMKGVSSEFVHLAHTKKLLIDGQFVLRDGDIDHGVIGVGMAILLGVRSDFVDPLEVYIPKRNVKVNLSNPSTAFDRADIFLSGVFSINQPKYDDQLFIVSIDLARELLRYDTEVSSLDIKLKDGASSDAVQKRIKQIIGDDYFVKNRFQQQEETFRMVNIEKWVTFFILSIILLIAIFNIIGSLSILIVEKHDDIRILQTLGADKGLVSRIFLLEGWLITFIGVMFGMIVGLAICFIQEYYGVLKLGANPGAFVVDAYPLSVHLFDIIVIFFTVCLIGFLAVIYPVNVLRKRI